MMQPANRVAINTVYLYTRMVITIFVSLYATRLILNALGAGDFGIFNLVGGVIAMLTFLNTSMASVTQRFMSYALGGGDLDKQKSIFTISIIIHLAIAALVVVLLETAGVFLFNGVLNIETGKIEAAKLVFHFMVISAFFTIISVPYDAVINANENMLFITILGVIEAFIKLGIAIYITLTRFDKLICYGLLTAALSVLLLIIRRIYCHMVYREVDIDHKKHYNKTLFHEMIKFAGWNFLGTSSGLLSNYGQVIIMNRFFGTAVNASQGIAVQASGQLSVFAGMMMKALNPIIDKSEGAGDRATLLKATIFGSKVSFFLLMFFFVPFLIEAPYILKLWLKIIPPYAIIFCQLVLLRALIEQLFTTLVSSITAVGNIKGFQISSSILVLLPLLVTYIFFKMGYPVYTTYIIFLGYSILASLNILYFSKTVFNLSVAYFFRHVIVKCIGSLIIVFSLSTLPVVLMPQGIIRLTLVEGINILAFLIIIRYWGFNKSEYTTIKQTMQAMFHHLLLKWKRKTA